MEPVLTIGKRMEYCLGPATASSRRNLEHSAAAVRAKRAGVPTPEEGCAVHIAGTIYDQRTIGLPPVIGSSIGAERVQDAVFHLGAGETAPQADQHYKQRPKSRRTHNGLQCRERIYYLPTVKLCDGRAFWVPGVQEIPAQAELGPPSRTI